MKVMVLHEPRAAEETPLACVDVPVPELGPGESRLALIACDVCRTGLHTVEGDLDLPRSPLIPGHQVVGAPQALGVPPRSGTLALAGVTMSPVSEMVYDRLRYWERTARSVANFTRRDAEGLLQTAAEIPIRTGVQAFPLEEANGALLALKRSQIDGTAVLTVS